MTIGGAARATRAQVQEENAGPRGNAGRKKNIFAKAVQEAKEDNRLPLLPLGSYDVKLVEIRELNEMSYYVSPVVEVVSEGEHKGEQFAILYPMDGKAGLISAGRIVTMVRCFAGMSADDFREYDPDGEFVHAMITGEAAPQGDDTVIGEVASVRVERGKDVPNKPGDFYREVYFSIFQE